VLIPEGEIQRSWRSAHRSDSNPVAFPLSCIGINLRKLHVMNKTYKTDGSLPSHPRESGDPRHFPFFLDSRFRRNDMGVVGNDGGEIGYDGLLDLLEFVCTT
jgi:hypothetical protein